MAEEKKAGISRRAFVLGGLAVALVALAVLFYTGGGREEIRHIAETVLPKAAPSEEETGGRVSVTLFFLSDDDDLLHRETREIAAGPTPADEAERALEELIKGSEKDYLSPLPPQARVRQVFVNKDGTAYVDFGKEIMEKFSYGSSSELAAVYAVVNTLAVNFRPIKRVVILVEGAERETLGGHVDLSRPFAANLALVAK
ncbi:MAG: GerMN domain-containing protein [Candidatus Aminicenantes bacterium]|nr:GerMN domain-containing protein [Candidatus Aminicenantes bacterium]